jgi:hypothetical protein
MSVRKAKENNAAYWGFLTTVTNSPDTSPRFIKIEWEISLGNLFDVKIDSKPSLSAAVIDASAPN